MVSWQQNHIHAVSVAGTKKQNSSLFGDLFFILYFIIKTRLFIFQLASQGKDTSEVNGEWEDSWDSLTSCHVTCQAVYSFLWNFERAADQQSRTFFTKERNFVSISFLSPAFRHMKDLLRELCFICLTTDICTWGIVLTVQKSKDVLQIRSHICADSI